MVWWRLHVGKIFTKVLGSGSWPKLAVCSERSSPDTELGLTQLRVRGKKWWSAGVNYYSMVFLINSRYTENYFSLFD